MRRTVFSLCSCYGQAIAVFLLLIAASATQAQTPRDWGRQSFDKELPRYQAAIQSREKAHRATMRSISARQKEIDDYLGSFLVPGRAAEIEAVYAKSDDADNRHLQLEQARVSAKSAEEVYRQHRALVDSGEANERSATTRAALWYEHLYWLDHRNIAAEREDQLLDARLVGLRGAAGFDTSEFWADNLEDMVFVFQEVYANFGKEASSCFWSRFRKSFTGAFTSTVGNAPTTYLAPSGPAKTPTLGSLIDPLSCISKPAMNIWVNALAAALKKQFLDDLRGKGVIEEVGLYWWDTLIVADDNAKRSFVESASREMFERDGMLSILKTHTLATAARVAAYQERPAIEQALAPMVNAGRLRRASARTSALQIAEKRGKARISELAKGLSLGVNLAAKAATLLSNSETFAEIEQNELAKYRRIVECLNRLDRPVDGDHILPYFRATSQASYVAFLKSCRADSKPEQSTPGSAAEPPPIDRNEAESMLGGIRSRVGDVGRQAEQATAACERAQAAAADLAAAWELVERSLHALRAAQGSAGADPGASAAQAEALARQAYAAGEIVSDARARGLREDAAACKAADELAQAALPERRQLRAKVREAAGKAEQAAIDAVAALSRARAALVSAELLKDSVSSGADRKAAIRIARDELRSSIAAAHSTAAAAQRAMSSAEIEWQRTQANVEALRGRIAAARDAGFDTAQLGLLAAEQTRLMEYLQSAQDCTADTPASLLAIAERGAIIEAEAEALLMAGGAAADTPSAGPQADRIIHSHAEAQASFDAADLLTDSARSAAASAEGCRARAEATPDPAADGQITPSQPATGWGDVPPGTLSDEPTAPAGPDWAGQQGQVVVDSTCGTDAVVQAFARADAAAAREALADWANAIAEIMATGCRDERLRGSVLAATEALQRQEARDRKIATLVQNQRPDFDPSGLLQVLTQTLGVIDQAQSAATSGRLAPTPAGRSLPAVPTSGASTGGPTGTGTPVAVGSSANTQCQQITARLSANSDAARRAAAGSAEASRLQRDAQSLRAQMCRACGLQAAFCN